MTQDKLPVVGGVRVRSYPVLARAVEEGVAYGWRWAHKHVDSPDEHTIKDQITQAVLNEICEYFDFHEDQVEE
jgi:hypothetical protein